MSASLIAALKPLLNKVCLTHHWETRSGGPIHIDAPLMRANLEAHLSGGSACGVCPITPGESTTHCAVLDLDSHKGEVTWAEMVAIARNINMALILEGYEPITFRSSGGKGIHIYLLWNDPQDAHSVRSNLRSTLKLCGYENGTKGVKQGEIEIFPKQDSVPDDGCGNMFILPLAKQSTLLDDSYQPTDTLEAGTWTFSDVVTFIPAEEKTVRQIIDETPVELAELKAWLDAIPNTGDEDLSYEEWRNIIFGIHHATDGSDEGLALAHHFSAKSKKYNPEFLDERVWPHIRSERSGNLITARTILATARKYGFEDSAILDDFEELPQLPDDGTTATTPAASTSTAVEATPIKKSRFTFHPALEYADRPAPEWIIKNVLPQADLVVLFGESGAGKSFIALDMACAIARGIEWRGHKTVKGRVAYIIAEGQGGFRNRLKAYVHQRQLTELDVFVLGVPPNFLLDDDVVVAQQIKLIEPVSLIIVDTFAQVTPGGNENSAEDMGLALSHFKRLHRATGATIMPIHHAGKDLSKGARGWSGLKAAADAELEVSRVGMDRFLTVSKLKDGEDGEQMGFRLVPIDIGVDEDDEPITSCIVEPTDRTKQSIKISEPSGKAQRHAWRVINDMLNVGEITVGRKKVIDQVVAETPSTGDEIKDKRFPDSARQALTGLRNNGWVTLTDNTITVCKR